MAHSRVGLSADKPAACRCDSAWRLFQRRQQIVAAFKAQVKHENSPVKKRTVDQFFLACFRNWPEDKPVHRRPSNCPRSRLKQITDIEGVKIPVCETAFPLCKP
jgi:hypothetical protein